MTHHTWYPCFNWLACHLLVLGTSINLSLDIYCVIDAKVNSRWVVCGNRKRWDFAWMFKFIARNLTRSFLETFLYFWLHLLLSSLIGFLWFYGRNTCLENSSNPITPKCCLLSLCWQASKQNFQLFSSF